MRQQGHFRGDVFFDFFSRIATATAKKSLNFDKINYMRIFIPKADIEKGERVRLSDDKSRYLISVLRCREGDKITVIDGQGKAYEAEISEISKRDVFINVISEILLKTESSLNLILCQGILKGEMMSMIIQKSTELGIKEIIPMVTERCLVKKTKKTKRWKKIAEEAVEQCERTVIPTIHEPLEFHKVLSIINAQQKKLSSACRTLPIINTNLMMGFIFWEEGGLPLSEAIQKIRDQGSIESFQPPASIFIFIGPEGGFTVAEVRLAEESGIIRTTLGRRILRAETAAIISVALVHFLLDDDK